MRLSLKMPSMVVGAALAAATLLAGAPGANATFVITTGNPGNAGTDNVLVNACTGNDVGPGTTVQGCLNTSHTTLVDVSTTGGGSLEANGGQARFDASGGDIGNFTINFNDPNLGFTKLIFNINVDGDSTASFTVNGFDALGNPESVTLSIDPDTLEAFTLGNGQNFFNLIASDGEVATSVTATSSETNIADIRQVRLNAVTVPTPPIEAPEPGTLALIGSALVGFGIIRRRKRA